MRCDVLAVGTELLLGQIVDTNSSWIGEQLAAAGIDTYEHRLPTVGRTGDVLTVRREFGANKLASIDKDMKVTEYTLPDAKARPRRIAIDSNDTVWYSDFDRGYLGKFDTKTGKLVKEYMSPSGPRSEPYGITVINDIVWYAEGNSKPNGLVRFDPKTEKFQTFPVLPSGGGVIRNMMPTKDGSGLVLAESGVNHVAIATVN